MGWMLAASAVGTLVVLLLLARRDERAVARDWDLLLTPRGHETLRRVERKVSTELGLADLSYDEAVALRELGSLEDARRLLDAGYKVIERFAPDMLRLLAAMATFSRMVSALAPVRPLRPRDFRLAQLASLAALGRLLHGFLVSSGERFRLRLYILGQSFGLATRYLLDSTRRLVAGAPGDAERDWQQIEAVRADLRVLADESLESLRVLLVSLGAERRDEVVARLLPPR